ncbi:MAG: cellulase family glycosylhydrolase [Hamadaea sp.]|nr:cellulase family glycosylhydrolase [Hamadaea sp.]NUR50799.1 cellulase family glycosylhydrolase [Hamadaea sp.]
MHRPLQVLTGEPLLGVNFWSRVGGPRMWTRYDPAVVAKELQVLADHGLTVTRSFFFWPDAMPAPDRLDEDVMARFADFLDQHSAYGLTTIPTLIVGHMSGENWDPSWRGGRDLYSDVWLVGRQAWFAEQVARRFAGHPAVSGWLLSNEMPLYGGRGTVETVSSWAQLVIAGLRAGGATQPVSIGDGAWTIELSGLESGFRLAELGPLQDWIGPHVYPMGDDQVRQHWRAAYTCELAHVAGKPVVLEEFGASSDFVSDDNVGHWYRQLLHTSLLAGSTGWVGWNNTDFDDLFDEPPYSHHPFELHFGVTDVHGQPKASLREMAAFRHILDAVDLPRCVREDSQVGLVVTSHADTAYPFTDERERRVTFAAVEQAYLGLRSADLPPALIRQSAGDAPGGIPDGCGLYVLPSLKQLTAPGWRRLEQLAEAGATVFVSYCDGGTDNQRGPWYAGVDRIFGVRHELRYGLVDRVEGPSVRFTVTRDFGGLRAGEALDFAVGGNEHLRAYLPVQAVDAEVLAVDPNGRPALLRRAVGDGGIVFCAYPLEAMAAATPHVNPDATGRLYAALAALAGVTPAVRVADPRVFVDALRHADGDRFVWLINAVDEPVTVVPVRADGTPAGLRDLAAGHEVAQVDLEPFGVRVLRDPVR